MKPWHTILLLLCLLASAFYLFSSSSSFSSSNYLTGRRSLTISLPLQKSRYPKEKVVDEGWQSSRKGSMWLKYSRRKENMDEKEEDKVVNFHIDYHGVTTHPTPTPTPKHPIPNP
ncbi:hypothetical protein CRYUN_Cryun30bG0107000 [Craigia yunnanensis]